MKITMSQFAALSDPVAVTIHSLGPALYQVSLLLDGQSRTLADEDGSHYRARNLQTVRCMLASMPAQTITMHHESAYDEMIGQEVRRESNTLAVNLKHIEQDDPV